MNKVQQTAFAFGVMALILLGLGFTLMFLGIDKPVSFVLMVLLIGGLFAGLTIVEIQKFLKSRNK